jgi:hypothetical protein
MPVMDDDRIGRHDLTDAEWAQLEPLLPAHPRQGHQRPHTNRTAPHNGDCPPCGACAPLTGRRLAACLPKHGCNRRLRGARPLSHHKGTPTEWSGSTPAAQPGQARDQTKTKVKVKVKGEGQGRRQGEGQGQGRRSRTWIAAAHNRWTADIRSCAIRSLAPSTSHAKRCLALRIPARYSPTPCIRNVGLGPAISSTASQSGGRPAHCD